MRLPVVALTLAAAAVRVAVAYNTVTIFLPDYEPWPSWQGEVRGIDATATTYVMSCVGPYARNCAVKPDLTVTQGPATLAYTDYGGYPGGVTFTARCDLPAETTALVTCPNQPGFTFTLPYSRMNPQLVEITTTKWYSGPPTATPTGRDPATASLFGSGTGRIVAPDCGGAIFCGGLFGPVQTGAPGGTGGGEGEGAGDSQTPTITAAPTPTDPNAAFHSAVAAVSPFVTDRIAASDIVGVIPVYDSGGTWVVASNAAWGVTTVSIGPGGSQDEKSSSKAATTTGRLALFSSSASAMTTRPSTTATSTGGAGARPTRHADAALLLGAAGLAALVQ